LASKRLIQNTTAMMAAVPTKNRRRAKKMGSTSLLRAILMVTNDVPQRMPEAMSSSSCLPRPTFMRAYSAPNISIGGPTPGSCP